MWIGLEPWSPVIRRLGAIQFSIVRVRLRKAESVERMVTDHRMAQGMGNIGCDDEDDGSREIPVSRVGAMFLRHWVVDGGCFDGDEDDGWCENRSRGQIGCDDGNWCGDSNGGGGNVSFRRC